MKCVLNPDDDISLERVLKTTTSIGDKTVSDLKNISSRENVSINKAIYKYNGKRTTQLLSTINNIMSLIEYSSKPALEFMNVLINRFEPFKKLQFSNTLENREKLGNIQELFNIAAGFKNDTQQDTITAFLDRISLSSNLDSVSSDNRVRIMTIHGSKGLEFDSVFMIGVEEELLPHKNSVTEQEIEEERRLMYVGITRAKTLLYITNTMSRTYFGKARKTTPSRFILEMFT